MFRIIILSMILLLSFNNSSFAEEYYSCQAARAANNTLPQLANQLVRDYPGTLAFYGFSVIMLNEANPQKLEEYAVGIGLAFIGCSIVIDTKSCDYVAGRIVTLLTIRAAVCVADQAYHCSICK